LDVVLRAPHLPALDETVTGSAVDYVFGGKGGNQAVAAARMGSEVFFAGRAGSDAFGNMIRETLAASGVDLSLLQRDAGPSGMSAAIVNSDGAYGAVIVSAANLNIEAEKVGLPDGTSLVLLQNEIPPEVNLAVAQKAKDAGALVWLNAAPARALPEALLAVIDLLIVNRVEARFYADADAALDVLVTLGGEGVLYKGDLYPAFPIEVVSTHGAGDMFVGALAAQIETGSGMQDSIRFAQAAAALHVASNLAERERIDLKRVAAFLLDKASQ
jgi:ribokinase